MVTDADSIVLRFLHSLRRSQWLAPEALQRHQRGLLERLLRHAAVNVPFHQGRLKPLFGAGDPRDAPIRWDAWPDLPIMTRSDALNHGEALMARSGDPESSEFNERATSGSTGQSLKIRKSLLADLATRAAKMRAYEINGADPAATMADITSPEHADQDYPEGKTSRSWNFLVEDAPRFSLDIRTEVGLQWEWLTRHWPDILVSYGANLRALADHAARFDRDGRRLRFCVNVAEQLDDDTRAELKSSFGCAVINLYESTEMGHIASSCPVCRGLHVAMESVHAELVDPAGKPVAPGEVGAVAATSLYNYAMPLIRYHFGDYATRGGAARCGRGLELISSIQGRHRNMLRLAGGRSIWPALKLSTLRKSLPFQKVRVVQTGIGRIEIQYVPILDAPAPDLAGIAGHVRTWAPEPLAFTLTPVPGFAVAENGKFEDFISLVATPGGRTSGAA